MSRDVSLLFDMTDAEIDADLRADGSDPDAIAKRGVELVQALLKRKRLPLDIPNDVRVAAVMAGSIVARREALIRTLQESDMMGLECAETVELEGLEGREIQAVRVIAPWILRLSHIDPAKIQITSWAEGVPPEMSNLQVSVRTGEVGDLEADLA